MKQILSTFVLPLLLGGLSLLAQAEQRITSADLQYEDLNTFKHKKPYSVDPWTWGYRKEFADRFRMPKEWVEPELKGALAVAFRVTNIGVTSCGYGGREDSCWAPMECQMDVYYDNQIDLGWGRPDIQQDFFMRGVQSTDYLFVTFQQKYGAYIKDDPHVEHIAHPVLIEDPDPSGNSKYGKLLGVIYYNKEYQPGIGLISLRGCPDRRGPANIQFEDPVSFNKARKGGKAGKDYNPTHVMHLPQSYRERLRQAYDRDSKSNRDTLDRLKRQFLDSKGITVPAGDNAAPR